MQLIDTHAHIYLPEFDGDLQTTLLRAADQGVSHILLPAIDRQTHALLLALEDQQPHCHAMMGVHPCSINENFEAELTFAEALLKRHAFKAIGEIGLDFYWDVTFKKQQFAAFERQIQWSIQYDLPIAIHSRNALAECIAVVQTFPQARGVFHCFSGTVNEARQIQECGFYLGIGGVVTYKKAGLDKVLHEIGLESVVLETDAPYLTPMPYRGKRNEPSYLSFIVAKIAEACGKSIQETAAITTQNAIRLFNLR